MSDLLNRYGDISKFVTDPAKLELKFGEEVTMSEDYHIVFDMEDAPCSFEELRTFIADLAKDICELDNIARKFSIHEGKDFSGYQIFSVSMDEDYKICLIYDSTKVANVCEVWFEKKGGKYFLRKFGWVSEIPDDWTGFHADLKDYTAEHGVIVKRKKNK